MSCSRSKKITLIGRHPNAFWGLAKKFMDSGYKACLYVYNTDPSVNSAQELRKEIRSDSDWPSLIAPPDRPMGYSESYKDKYTITENLTEAIKYSQRIVVDLDNAHYPDLIRRLGTFDLSQHSVEVTTDGHIDISIHGDVALFKSLVYQYGAAWRPKEIRGANY